MKTSPSFDDVLVEYLSSIDRSTPIDRQTLIEKYPHLRQQLVEYFHGEDLLRAESRAIQDVLTGLSHNSQHSTHGNPLARETPQATVTIDNPARDSTGKTTIATPVNVSHDDDAEDAWGLPKLKGYAIIREIARGGMGIVYEARQESLNRIVALKVIQGSRFRSAEALARFAVEAKAAAKLQHEGIVSIFDSGVDDGVHYYAMEYVNGRTLTDVLRKDKLTAKEAARKLLAVSKAVGHAHDNSILHRDLKPGNILVNQQDQSLVTDFGIARNTETDSDLTDDGQVLGTPSYMSPEQSHGRAVGVTTDVYSLGAVLYSMLTSRPPFEGRTNVDTLIQLRTQEPTAPHVLNATVPKDLETVCLKCLNKNPARRYQTADELATELQRYLDGRPILARPAGPIERLRRWCMRNVLVASLILVIGLSLLTGTIVSGSMYLAEAAALDDANTNLSRMYVYSAGLDKSENALSALPWLAKSLEVNANNPERQEMDRHRLASAFDACPELVQLWNLEESAGPMAFSPDGSQVLTTTGAGVAQVWDLETGKPASPLMEHNYPIVTVEFSPDGQYIATATQAGFACVWDVTIGERLCTLQHDANADGNKGPSWVNFAKFYPNADDQLLVVTGAMDHTARIWNVHEGTEVARLEHPGSVGHCLFLPGNRGIVTSCSDANVRVWNWHPQLEEPASIGRTMYHEFRRFKWRLDDPINVVALSADGGSVVTGAFYGALRIWDVETGEQRQNKKQTRHDKSILRIALSDDGELMASASQDGAVRLWYLPDGDPVDDRQLELDEPVWSLEFAKDNRTVFIGTANGDVRIWDVHTGDMLGPVLPHHRSIRQMEVHDTSESTLKLLTRSGQLIRLWDISKRPHQQTIPQYISRKLIRAPDDDRFIVAAYNEENSIAIFDVNSREQIRAHYIKVPDPIPSERTAGDPQVAIHPAGQIVALSGYEDWIVLFDLDAAEESGPRIHWPGMMVKSLSFSSDGLYLLATASAMGRIGRTVACWRLGDTGSPLWTTAGSQVITESNQTNGIVTVFDENKLRRLEVATGKGKQFDVRHPSQISLCSISPNEKYLAKPAGNGTTQVISLLDGSEVCPPLKTWANVIGTRFDGSGERLVTWTSEGVARVWDVATGRAISRRLTHESSRVAPKFHDDGTRLLTFQDEPATEFLWDWRSGELAAVRSNLDHIVSASFTHDGENMILLQQRSLDRNPECVVRLVPIGPDFRSLDDLRLEAEILSGVQIDEMSDRRPLSADELSERWQQLGH